MCIKKTLGLREIEWVIVEAKHWKPTWMRVVEVGPRCGGVYPDEVPCGSRSETLQSGVSTVGKYFLPSSGNTVWERRWTGMKLW